MYTKNQLTMALPTAAAIVEKQVSSKEEDEFFRLVGTMCFDLGTHNGEMLDLSVWMDPILEDFFLSIKIEDLFFQTLQEVLEKEEEVEPVS